MASETTRTASSWPTTRSWSSFSRFISLSRSLDISLPGGMPGNMQDGSARADINICTCDLPMSGTTTPAVYLVSKKYQTILAVRRPQARISYFSSPNENTCPRSHDRCDVVRSNLVSQHTRSIFDIRIFVVSVQQGFFFLQFFLQYRRGEFDRDCDQTFVILGR